MGSGHRWRGRESLVVPRRTQVRDALTSALSSKLCCKCSNLGISTVTFQIQGGAAANPAIKTHAESLVRFDNFCAADQACDFAPTIIDRETAVAPQEVPFNSFL